MPALRIAGVLIDIFATTDEHTRRATLETNRKPRRIGLWFLSVSVAVICLFFVTSGWRVERNACPSGGRVCYSVVTETFLGIDSPVYPYVLPGRRYFPPIVMLDYVKYEDSEGICVKLERDGRLMIYSRYPPLENTMADQVHVVSGKPWWDYCPSSLQSTWPF